MGLSLVQYGSLVMKKIILLMCLIVSNQVMATPHPTGYERKYDRFRNYTLYSYSTNQAITPFFSFKIINSLDKNTSDSFMTGVMFYHNRSGVHDYCYDAEWLVDGQAVEPMLSSQKHEGYDIYLSTFDIDQVLKMANAKKVEYRICDLEFSLSKKDIQGIDYTIKQYIAHLGEK